MDISNDVVNIKCLLSEPTVEINLFNLIVDIGWVIFYAIWSVFYAKLWTHNDLYDSNRQNYIILLLYMISIFYTTIEVIIGFIVDVYYFNKTVLISNYKKSYVLNNKVILSVQLILNIFSKIIPLLLIPKITMSIKNCPIENIGLCVMSKIGGLVGLIYLSFLVLPTIGLVCLIMILFCNKKNNVEIKKSMYYEIRKRLFPRRILQKLMNIPFVESISLIRLLTTFIGSCSMCFKYGLPYNFKLECGDVFCVDCANKYITKTMFGKKCPICYCSLANTAIVNIETVTKQQTPKQKINVSSQIVLV